VGYILSPAARADFMNELAKLSQPVKRAQCSWEYSLAIRSIWTRVKLRSILSALNFGQHQKPSSSSTSGRVAFQKFGRGSLKFYLVDLALRNAVLRLPEDITSDAETMGLYAENLVFNALRKWRGTLTIDYYRDRDGEIDFIVHTCPQRDALVESKYRESINDSDLRTLRNFARRFGRTFSLVISKRIEDLGWRGDVVFPPLLHFLLFFD
jgi:Holliday junction resolvase-like predicted endonuclease